MLSQTSTFNGDSLIARFSSLSAGATKNLCLINHSKRTVNVISAVGPQSLRQILVKKKNRATKTRFLLTCLGNLQVRNSILHDKQKKKHTKNFATIFPQKKVLLRNPSNSILLPYANNKIFVFLVLHFC